jgi:NADH dehydrogenase FAD-containing subunit
LYNPDTHSIKVNDKLQLADGAYPNIFVAGDVADTKEVKMSYKTSLHAPVIAKNINSLLKGQKPTAVYTPPSQEMMALPLGKSGGVTFIPMFGGMSALDLRC